MKQDFAKAESTLLHVTTISETIYGPDDNRMAMPWTSLCFVYDQWGKQDKSASCHAHLVSMVEKQFGPNSPYLIRELTAEADAQRKLGRTDEAAKLEKRTQSIQAAQSNTN